MSERQPTYEAGQNVELDPRKLEKINDEAAERRREAAEKAETNQESLESIRRNIEKTASTKEEIEVSRIENGASESVLKASGQLKGVAFKQRMREVQRTESPAARAFSKVIHQPVVEEVSNLAEGTIARPSGLLFAGIVSVISSLVILYISRHYGYEYNFLVGLAGLAGGFVLGLLLEGIWRIFKPRHH